jgi:protein-L-isoaspartate(D-aspartate) O-methyltransferase
MVPSATPAGPVPALAPLLLLLVLLACGPRGAAGGGAEDAPGPAGAAAPAARAPEREAMVARQLAGRDITDPRVLAAMRTIPRHEFVPPDVAGAAYQDSPLPIGLGQTISQPYIVALMTQLAQPGPQSRALDVGTGSGYQAAVLAEVAGKVYSIEILCELAREAEARLDRLGYRNVEVRCGDGYRGWPEAAPFDLIIVAAAPEEIPQPLIDQLAPGGRLVIPVGEGHQELIVVERSRDGAISRFSAGGVRFVPMTGEAQKR